MRIKIPNTAYRKFFVLCVSYDANWDFPKTDKRIAKLLGQKPKAAGINLVSKERDLNFEYEKEKEAEEARKTLKKEGFNSLVQTFERDTL